MGMNVKRVDIKRKISNVVYFFQIMMKIYQLVNSQILWLVLVVVRIAA